MTSEREEPAAYLNPAEGTLVIFFVGFFFFIGRHLFWLSTSVLLFIEVLRDSKLLAWWDMWLF